MSEFTAILRDIRSGALSLLSGIARISPAPDDRLGLALGQRIATNAIRF